MYQLIHSSLRFFQVIITINFITMRIEEERKFNFKINFFVISYLKLKEAKCRENAIFLILNYYA